MFRRLIDWACSFFQPKPLTDRDIEQMLKDKIRKYEGIEL